MIWGSGNSAFLLLKTYVSSTYRKLDFNPCYDNKGKNTSTTGTYTVIKTDLPKSRSFCCELQTLIAYYRDDEPLLQWNFSIRSWIYKIEWIYIWEPVLCSLWFRCLCYSTRCPKNYCTTWYVLKISWKNLWIQFAWVSIGHQNLPNLITKTNKVMQSPLVLDYFWTSIFLKDLK